MYIYIYVYIYMYCIYLLLLYFCSTHQCDIQTLVSTIIHPLLATPIRFLSICAWLSGWFVHSGAGTSPLGAGDMIRPGHHKTCDWLAGDVPTQMIQIIQYIYLSSVCHRSRPANNRKCKRAQTFRSICSSQCGMKAPNTSRNNPYHGKCILLDYISM